MMNLMLKLRKRNKKGFSLVELIIVIAIMAIMVGILAPQFVKYIGKSRESTDIKNFQEVASAIQVYSADVDAVLPTGDTEVSETFALTKGAGAVVTGDTITAALTAAGMDAATIKGQSDTFSGATNAVLTAKFKNGQLTSISYGGTNAARLTGSAK